MVVMLILVMPVVVVVVVAVIMDVVVVTLYSHLLRHAEYTSASARIRSLYYDM